MKLGISLYPGLDADREKSLLLLQKAAALGYSRVFSSLHIPESNAASLREDALYLFACAESLGLDVIGQGLQNNGRQSWLLYSCSNKEKWATNRLVHTL